MAEFNIMYSLPTWTPLLNETIICQSKDAIDKNILLGANTDTPIGTGINKEQLKNCPETMSSNVADLTSQQHWKQPLV